MMKFNDLLTITRRERSEMTLEEITKALEDSRSVINQQTDLIVKAHENLSEMEGSYEDALNALDEALSFLNDAIEGNKDEDEEDEDEAAALPPV